MTTNFSVRHQSARNCVRSHDGWANVIEALGGKEMSGGIVWTTKGQYPVMKGSENILPSYQRDTFRHFMTNGREGNR